MAVNHNEGIYILDHICDSLLNPLAATVYIYYAIQKKQTNKQKQNKNKTKQKKQNKTA